MALDKMELLQRTLAWIWIDSGWMEMPLGHVTLEIGRARHLFA